jgi:hypothetical protein
MFHHVSKVILCDRRNTFASFSEDDVHVSWQAQHFGRAHLHFAWQAQHFIDVWCCLFFANRIVRAASRGGKMQIAWQALHFATCDSDEN